MSNPPDVLDRATLEARHVAVHTALLEAMRTVERYRGALGLLEELLALPDPPPPAEHAARGLEAVA
jgi:hypothetical protein